MAFETQEVATQTPVLKIDHTTGTKSWTVDGNLHREDGPASEWYEGSKEWWLHREDGPAIEYASGTKAWYLYGYLHREDGPAYENADDMKWWYHHGQSHREDGPAVEHSDGTGEWRLNNEEYTKPEWLREVLKDRPLTTHQRDLLDALSENWAGNAESLYVTVTHLVSAGEHRE